MQNSKHPFWEESYKRPGKLNTFGGGKPSREVVGVASQMKLPARALDLCCGEGRNALYLAQIGFETSAIDISESGIQKLRTLAIEMHVNIDASVCDMRDYSFNPNFDLIVCLGCLHLIEKKDWRQVLANMKKHTFNGGIHITGVFTDEIPEPEDQRGLMIGLFKEGELFTYYKDWEVINTRTFIMEDEHPDGRKHKHSGNNIIARKP